ncbi:MAG: alpha-hydroxy acid oxidase [Gemmatimonadaceae bacterium]
MPGRQPQGPSRGRDRHRPCGARPESPADLLGRVHDVCGGVNAARPGQPVWYQLYPIDVEDVGMAIARRAERAGCPALILTVDLNAGRNLETQLRLARTDTRTCSQCHGDGIPAYVRRKPMFDGLDVSRVTAVEYPGMTWDYVRRMRDNVPKMKLVIKASPAGILTAAAVMHSIDAIVVSNHGGRAEDSGRSTIECLPEVLGAVAHRVPVLIDSGFRRGTDVVKAIALGATAVGVGRPYLWGLAAFGQPGVEWCSRSCVARPRLVMRQLVATTILS